MKSKVPNAVLTAERRRRGWGRDRAAAVLISAARELGLGITTSRENVVTQIKRCETGETAVPDQDYLTLFSHVYGKPSTELFGQHLDPQTRAATVNGVSHKLLCGVIDAAAVELLAKTHGLTESGDAGRLSGPVNGPAGQAGTLHVSPCGAVIHHIEEPQNWPGLADLAIWRYQTYRDVRAWFANHLRTTVGEAAFNDRRADAVYVFSIYWIDSSPWIGDELDNGLRLLSMPSILLDRDTLKHDPAAALANARSAELSLLRDGADRDDLCCFSSPGAAIGYASWSGISYHPIVPPRALDAGRLVDVELTTQTAWAYSHDVIDQVRHGADVETWADGLRYLRGARALLSTSMPREDGQSRSMRAAIVQSSGVIPALDQAIDELRH